MSQPSYVLTILCPDRPGIVHAVSGFLVQHGGNILESQQYDDLDQDRFFMRVLFAAPPRPPSTGCATSFPGWPPRSR